MKYRVYATMTSNVYIDVEANSPEEAYEIYDETDGGDFIESGCGWYYDGMMDLETGKFVEV